MSDYFCLLIDKTGCIFGRERFTVESLAEARNSAIAIEFNPSHAWGYELWSGATLIEAEGMKPEFLRAAAG